MMESSPFQRYRLSGLQEPIRLPTPATQLSWISFGCAVFAILGAILFFNAEDGWDQAVAVLCILLTGIVGAIVIPPLMKGKEIAVFDREGLYTRRYDVKILWSDLTAVAIVKSGEYESLCMTVRDYEKYRSRIPWQAAWMRMYYKNIWARGGAVTLLYALDPLTGKELMEAMSEIEEFDFFLSHYEFPTMMLSEVKAIVENEIRANYNQNPNREMERPIMMDETKEPSESYSESARFSETNEIHPSPQPILSIPGWAKHAEASGDSGGAMWYEEAIVELWEDRVRVSEYQNQQIQMKNEILLEDISDIKIHVCLAEDEYGCLKFSYRKKSFWDYLLKLFPFEIYFKKSQEEQFMQLSGMIRTWILAHPTRKPGADPATGRSVSSSDGHASISSPHPKSPTPSLSDLEVLNKLADLKEKGILSEDEFNAKKKQILGL